MSEENNGRNNGITKIPQPHGGALNSGGTPGNRGGRPSSELRGNLREILEAGLPALAEFAQGTKQKRFAIDVVCPGCDEEFQHEVRLPGVKPTDQLKALELAARHGLTDQADRQLVADLAGVVTEVLAQLDDADALLQAVYAGWAPVLAARLK